jgi:hypothetical protein
MISRKGYPPITLLLKSPPFALREECYFGLLT